MIYKRWNWRRDFREKGVRLLTNFSFDGYRVDIDIVSILSEYSWHKPTWKPDKLIAASPFRNDGTPSFFVNLQTGAWGDSGAYDMEYESGNIAKLLAFLRNETYEETLEYLVDTYGVREKREGDRIEIPSVTLSEKQPRIEIDEDFLQPYKYRNPYLVNRGISEKVQRFMGVGYDKKSQAVTLPWRHADGKLANVKFRRVIGKTFWYTRGAAPVRSLVYGIDKVYRKGLKTVVICEAEIDALSWMTCGIPAIALGGTTVTETQLNIIRRSPIETLYKAMDNDKPGMKMSRKLSVGLNGDVNVKDVKIPDEYNDANEALVNDVDLSSLV